MRWRGWMVALLALVACSCEYRELVRFADDGSATVVVELDADLAEAQNVTWIDQAQVEAIAADVAVGDDTSARDFLAEFFALEAGDPFIDDAIGDEFVFTLEDEQLHTRFDVTARLRDELLDGSLLLGFAEVRSSGGVTTLESSADEQVSTFLQTLLAIEGDPFAADAATSTPIRVSVEIEVPGEIEASDAHDRDSGRERWTWEVGMTPEPGISLAWSPEGNPDSESGGGLVWLLVLAAIVVATVAYIVARQRPRDRPPETP